MLTFSKNRIVYLLTVWFVECMQGVDIIESSTVQSPDPEVTR